MKFREKGTIIIISFIVITILFGLGSYFLNSAITETRISKSMETAAMAYYLAESGIHEAIWKLKNDDVWQENFISPSLNPDINGNYWSDSFTREGVEGGSYTVSIENFSCGRGEIISIAEIPFFGNTAKRKIKTSVFRGIEGPTENAAIFSGGNGENISITHTWLKINNGNLFSNHNLNISGESVVEVYDNSETEILEGQILAVHNIHLGDESEITEYTLICSKDWCMEECEICPPKEISVPMVDFDSENSDSYKSRAEAEENCSVFCKLKDGEPYLCANECIFSSTDFEDLLWEVGEGGSLILENKITYIIGSMELRGGRSIEVNGVLIVDGNVDIGERYSWVRGGQKDEGVSHIEIIQPAPNNPSGLLSKRKINFGPYSFSSLGIIEGVIYAGDEIKMTSIPEKLNVVGGIIARKFSFVSILHGLEIFLDNEKIMYGLGYIINGEIIEPFFSPVVQVDHWEEAY